MVGTSPCLVVASLLLATAAASAPLCGAALPEPGRDGGTEGGAKFRLIATQCPALGAPAEPRRAEQLALFERATALTITLVDAPAAEPGRAATFPFAAAAEPMPAPEAPLGPAGARIVALAPALLAAARANDLDPLLLHALAHVESRHQPQAVSPAGARGLMQVMPATAQRFGVADERALFDAETNLRAAAGYLRSLQRRYAGDLRLVLAAYNAGEGAVDKAGRDVPRYAETQAYVRDVLAVYGRLTAAFSVSAAGALVARGS
jgi:soluble lytic murein transglycosylase-like protein